MKRIDPDDLIVGASIRLHRIAANMSQTQLGEKLGVTFQQIQKYEKGANRVGAGRLLKIAHTLKVPITAFYTDTKPHTGKLSPLMLIAERDALRLVQSFQKITNKRLRNTIVGVVTAIADQSG